MDLSIIIPIYNVENYLDECISSLYCQGLDKSEFEVILVDDGSKDSSLEIARKWARNYSNIKVLHQENQGQAAARNLGLEVAKGKYLMFVDSDDFLYKNTLSGPLRCISDNDYDCVNFRLSVEQQDGTIIKNHIEGAKFGQIYSGEFVALNFDVFSSVCAYIFKSDIFRVHHLRFKKGFAHEDCELCFRLFPHINKMCFYDCLVYHYRFNPISTDRSSNLNSLRRKYNSDLLIAAELKDLVLNGTLSKQLKKRYNMIQNSMVISHFLFYQKNPILFDTKNDYYSLLKSLKIFPLTGSCVSLKSTLFMYFLNLNYYLSCFRRKTRECKR